MMVTRAFVSRLSRLTLFIASLLVIFHYVSTIFFQKLATSMSTNTPNRRTHPLLKRLVAADSVNSSVHHSNIQTSRKSKELKAFRLKDIVENEGRYTITDMHYVEKDNPFYGEVESDEIVYGVIVCQVPNALLDKLKDKHYAWGEKSFLRQMQQTEALLKSAAVFTHRRLHFIFMTNTNSVFMKIKDIVNEWPQHIKEKLRVTRRPVWKPPNQEKMMTSFRVCAAAKLFLHEALPELDAVIFLDTDTFFVRPPEDLWSVFANFTSKQIAGIAPGVMYYGVNSGVVMMNMTRMRNHLSFDLTNKFIEIYEEHKNQLYIVDQEMINYLYGRYPELLYSLDCSWNMRPEVCRRKPFTCNDGVSLIHGAGLRFFDEVPSFITGLFNVFLHLDMNQANIESVHNLMTEALYKTPRNTTRECEGIEGFEKMVLKYPSTKIQETHLLR